MRLDEPTAAPRISDLGALIPSTTGKIELETLNDEAPEERVVERLIARALANVFGRRVTIDDLDPVVRPSRPASCSRPVSVSARGSTSGGSRETPGLAAAVSRLGGGDSPAAVASGVEFLLEGLHLHRRLNKDRASNGGGRYRR